MSETTAPAPFAAPRPVVAAALRGALLVLVPAAGILLAGSLPALAAADPTGTASVPSPAVPAATVPAVTASPAAAASVPTGSGTNPTLLLGLSVLTFVVCAGGVSLLLERRRR